ncbi:VCBS repeat domain-containing M23 family metallopeptidase [Nonomuraea sp. NPDC050643]|uniref:VCBS repeat domain-containing M23 family metallopeptidase n=1 Tax=Nonomuraea sp. NPDC050643 TaxID=3155660 RepID=UPI0033C71014
MLRRRITVALSALALAALPAPRASAAAMPGFQLPFPCGQEWQLNAWAHAPALDMVKEPDQQGTNGAQLVAPADGVVNQAFYHANAGNMVQINHGGGWFTTYIHLQDDSVAVGQRVEQGEPIGQVGATGPTSNGHPHLHYEQGFDANGDGRATWGADGTERVRPFFNGVEYGQADGMEWNNVRSANGCATAPTEDGTVQFADLDGDGRDEIIRIWTDGNVTAYRNRGWDAAKVYDGPDSKLVAQGFTEALRTKFADLDGDGRAEIVRIWADGDVTAYRNRGWDAAKVYDGPDSKLVAEGFADSAGTRFADLDGDGRAEIVRIWADGNVTAYRNRGWDAAKVYDGPDSKLVAQGFTNVPRVRFADLDGDGRAEIVRIWADGSVTAYRNRGWDAAKVYDGPDSRTVAEGFTDALRTKFGDLDGDGRAEIVRIWADGNVTAYRNRGWDAAKVYDGPDSRTVAQGFTI